MSDDRVKFNLPGIKKELEYPKSLLFPHMKTSPEEILGEVVHSVAIPYYDSVQNILDDMAERMTMIHPYKALQSFDLDPRKPWGHILVGIREKKPEKD